MLQSCPPLLHNYTLGVDNRMYPRSGQVDVLSTLSRTSKYGVIAQEWHEIYTQTPSTITRTGNSEATELATESRSERVFNVMVIWIPSVLGTSIAILLT